MDSIAFKAVNADNYPIFAFIPRREMSELNVLTLPNGIRVVHLPVPHTKIVHCGFVLDIGSRDELENQLGIAHFWEHMAFKGTKKRKAFHILNKLDSVGGELNAYTTKEKICFYASVLDRHIEGAFELLKDITFDSIFPEKQIENERGVILEEMSLYRDNPEDAIQDELDQVIYGDHPLGQNILGTTESVKSFHKDDFQTFIGKNLNTERIVFSCVGNIPFNKIKRLVRKYFEDIPMLTGQLNRVPFTGFKPQHVVRYKSITQAHCALGTVAYPTAHENRLPFFMLVNLLGGPGMNSRLNMALRERKGFVYHVEASYHSFIETGLFGIYFGTEKGQVNRSLKLIDKELEKLRSQPLGTLQLHKAKEQLIGQLAMAEENNVHLMLMLGKGILDRGEIESLEEVFTKIRNISNADLLHVANEVLPKENISSLIFLPQN